MQLNAKHHLKPWSLTILAAFGTELGAVLTMQVDFPYFDYFRRGIQRATHRMNAVSGYSDHFNFYTLVLYYEGMRFAAKTPSHVTLRNNYKIGSGLLDQYQIASKYHMQIIR